MAEQPDNEQDLTETARKMYDLPFHRENDLQVSAVTPMSAELVWPFEEKLIGNTELRAIHGGVISALIDVTGGLPFTAEMERYTPTIDLRVDYLSHAGPVDLVARSQVQRKGSNLGVSHVDVLSNGEEVAKGVGVYKISR